MITITAEQKTGATTSKVKVSATTIERALKIAVAGADSVRLVLPIDGQEFFTRSGAGVAGQTEKTRPLVPAAA